MRQRLLRIIRPVATLLPLRIRRQATSTYEHSGYILRGDPRHGMPDARDLLALALCVDAALRGERHVQPCSPVTVASLLRVAGLHLQSVEGERTRSLVIAKEWTCRGAIVLAADWCDWVRSVGEEGELTWPLLSSVSPGARVLAVILATEQRNAIRLPILAAQCGTRAATKGKAYQQVRKWLDEVRARGMDNWAFEPDGGFVYRRLWHQSGDASGAKPQEHESQQEGRAWLPNDE